MRTDVANPSTRRVLRDREPVWRCNYLARRRGYIGALVTPHYIGQDSPILLPAGEIWTDVGSHSRGGQ